MGDIIGKIVVLFLAISIFYIYPVFHMYEEQDSISEAYVFVETCKFVDEIRSKGYISSRMYREFALTLQVTDIVYNIELEHSHRNYNPVFDDIDDSSTYEDDYNLYYIPYFTDEILEVLYPDSGMESTYYLSEGDYILVKVTNKTKTKATKLKEMIFSANLPDQVIVVRYGGMIKNEVN